MSTKREVIAMQDRHQSSKLFEQWIRIRNKIIRSESIPHDFGTGNPIFVSEIHTLCAIGTVPGINITDLSVRLGVTKGAISKITRKMEEKDLIERYQKAGNDKEILLRLTPRGKKGYLGHEEYHVKAFERLSTEMEKLTDDQIIFLFQVFGFIEEMIDATLLDTGSSGTSYKEIP